MNAKTYSMPYGFMVVWDKVDDAARYFLHLKIASFDKYEKNSAVPTKEITDEKEICCVEIDRNTLYYTFDKLADMTKKTSEIYGTKYFECKNYLVTIEAENKSGEIIEKCENISGLVKYASLTHNGGFMYCQEKDWRNRE